ncbi:MAG: tetratricopeptide repeat protein [Acidobacteria bacterium]|nr:tetratricopeptide repeat protein [Acidobacteriota bacterium]MYD70659.1 tetratricopeptide repeat protein [Acidobacteriota bacterium]MYJ03281.1 tetratricopeptide repeat protein [Acidobacteriota bacterium]
MRRSRPPIPVRDAGSAASTRSAGYAGSRRRSRQDALTQPTARCSRSSVTTWCASTTSWFAGNAAAASRSRPTRTWRFSSAGPETGAPGNRRTIRARRLLRDYNRDVSAHDLSCACLALLIALALPAAGSAQTPEADLAFHHQATRALAHGDAEAAEDLAGTRESSDPAAAALRARRLIETGRYEEAEALLDPVARAAPGTVAGLEFGRLLATVGRVDEAARFLEAVIVAGQSTPDPLLQYYGGLASQAAGGFRRANMFFRGASRSLPEDPAVHTAWGDLFLEKYNYADAQRSYQDALALDGEWSPALVGLAQVLANAGVPIPAGGPGAEPLTARGAAERALAIDPTNARAHLLIAELELADQNRDAARESIDAVLDHNPNHLEARALVAAIAWLEDRRDDFENEVAGILAINPVYADAYRIAGYHVARAYRFPEAVTLVRRALELNPDHIRAHADLGMHLLRTGDEPGARAALERSFEADPYDVVTFNLLEMLDQLDEFETFEEGDLIVRLHPEEAPAIRDYVIDVAQEALDTLSALYNMTPETPVLIEIFPRHDDFAVRTLGLPGMVGALGACFGRVVTMVSPRASPSGSFHWLSTLWHEMAHVVTLQMSNQRLTRSLSEGISSFEEKRRHPAWERDQLFEFLTAINAGNLRSIAELDSEFTQGGLGLAYFHASLVVQHIVETYGDDTLQTLIRAYGDGLDTEGGLERIGLTFDSLQAGFDADIEERYGELRRALEGAPAFPPGEGEDRLELLHGLAEEHPGSFQAQMALGVAARAAGLPDEARAAFERAVELFPITVGLESPRGQLALIAEEEGDTEQAMHELELLLEHDESSPETARMLAALAEGAEDDRRLRIAYERLIEIDPFDPIPHQTLGRMAKEDGRTEVALRELRIALALGPVDRVATHTDYAETLIAVGDLDAAKRQAMLALEIAPTYERAQDALLRVIEASP